MTRATLTDGTVIEIDDSTGRWSKILVNKRGNKTLRQIYEEEIDKNQNLSANQKTNYKKIKIIRGE